MLVSDNGDLLSRMVERDLVEMPVTDFKEQLGKVIGGNYFEGGHLSARDGIGVIVTMPRIFQNYVNLSVFGWKAARDQIFILGSVQVDLAPYVEDARVVNVHYSKEVVSGVYVEVKHRGCPWRGTAGLIELNSGECRFRLLRWATLWRSARRRFLQMIPLFKE